MFVNSTLNDKLKNGVLMKCPRHVIDNEDPIPIFILGDPVYPLLPYLMREYASGGATVEKQYFWS